MLSIILTNLRRRPSRTAFTAAGIAVGVATIVALLSFTEGLSETAAALTHLGGSDLGVFQANVSDPTASSLPESLVPRLQAKPYIARATPLMLIVEGVKAEPAAVVFGADPHGFFARSLVIVRGAGDRIAASSGGTSSASTRGGGTSSASTRGGGTSSASTRGGGTSSASTRGGGTSSASTRGGEESAGETGTGGTSPDNGILVGERLAEQLHLEPGGHLTVRGHAFAIAGIYHSGILFEDSGAVLPLARAQALAGRRGEATSIAVDLAGNARSQPTAKAIEREFPGTQVISTPQQALRAGANGTLISKAILVIVVIALIVGAIGVTNTMALAIIERQTELGLLSTVGWSPLRVAALILGEGIAVSILGAALGLLLGVIGGDLLVRVLGVSSYVSPSVTAWGLGRGVLVGIAIGVLGDIYPAWRVTRMKPLKALAGT